VRLATLDRAPSPDPKRDEAALSDTYRDSSAVLGPTIKPDFSWSGAVRLAFGERTPPGQPVGRWGYRGKGENFCLGALFGGDGKPIEAVHCFRNRVKDLKETIDPGEFQNDR
jgi:hypothetical protein